VLNNKKNEMNNIRGIEFHSIIQNIFGDVKGINVSEQLQVNCPKCQKREGLLKPDGKYNLEINTAKRVFRCWKCDDPKFSGSLGSLIKIFGNSSDFELYKSYASIYQEYVTDDNIEIINVQLPNEMILFSDMDINNPEHLQAYNYLVLDRKINRELILKYRLGFCLEGKYSQRIIIPSYDANGILNYFVARSYNPKIKRSKYLNPNVDKNSIIFNEGYINWDSTIFLVEGVFDMLSIPVNTIPLLGKTISALLFKRLSEYKPNVVIILDPDAYKDSINLFYTLQSIYIDCDDKIRLVKLPTNEDIDELRREKGVEFVKKCVYGARKLITEDYFISKLNNYYGTNNRRY